MKTTADEKLDSCKNRVRNAINDLTEILVNKCFGHDEYTKEYKLQLINALKLLLDASSELDLEPYQRKEKPSVKFLRNFTDGFA